VSSVGGCGIGGDRLGGALADVGGCEESGDDLEHQDGGDGAEDFGIAVECDRDSGECRTGVAARLQ